MSNQPITTPPAPADPPATPTPAVPAPAAEPAAGLLPVGTLVTFETTDTVTALPISGIGIVRGHVGELDTAGNLVGDVRTRITVLPNDYVLVSDDELHQV